MNRVLFLGLLLVAMTGCKSTYLADDVDFDFDFFELIVTDDLHPPYVAGARVTISAWSTDDDEDRTGWQLVTSDPNVLRIEDQADGTAHCVAVASGVATILAFDADGEEIADGEVEVRNATRVELWPHGWSIVDQPRREIRPAILAGGTATFEVRYFDGDQELHGSGALSVEADPSMDATPQQTLFFERREWLQVTPADVGEHTMRVFVAGQELPAFLIDVVTPADVDSLSLVHEADWEAEDDHVVTVLAQAFMADGRLVYGVDYAWDLDGDGQAGLGDLFRYVYDEGRERVLGSEFDGLRAETIIEASSGHVDSSNNIGCAMHHGDAPWGWLIALGIILRLRSRSTSRRRPAR